MGRFSPSARECDDMGRRLSTLLQAYIGFGRQGQEAMRRRVIPVVVCSWFALAGAPAARAQDLNDYPTVARADYVFACMKANGDTRHALEQCSCSIDIIASVLPYERYVTAETVLSMSQTIGNLGAQFRSTEQAKNAVNDLRRAQAEAEVRCF
jgi:hypothetical protein